MRPIVTSRKMYSGIETMKVKLAPMTINQKMPFSESSVFIAAEPREIAA